MPRKKVVAPTLRELITKIGKNEGKTRNDYTSLLEMEKDLVVRYEIKSDYERNQFVALRLDEPRVVSDSIYAVYGDPHEALKPKES